MSGEAPRDSRALAAAAACVVLGAVLRALPCGNDFWLDEIWSYDRAMGLDSVSGTFTALHYSNNHHRVTAYMALVGDWSQWWVYRLPSLLAGVCSVALAACCVLKTDVASYYASIDQRVGNTALPGFVWGR